MNDGLTKIVVIRLPPATHEKLMEISEHADRTISQTIRRAIRVYLDEGAP